MGSKDKKKGSGRRSKTPGQASASSPKPTATSPSGDATTTSLVPSSAFPSAPPTTTTPQDVPSASPQPTSILASSASKITTTQPLPSAPPPPPPPSPSPSVQETHQEPPPPPPPVQETHQEFVSCTSEGSTTTTDLPGPSTAPSESAARTRDSSTFMPVTDEYLSLIAPAIACAMTAFKSVKEEDQTDLQEMIIGLFGLKIDDMETVFGSLWGLVEMIKDNAELRVSLETLFDMEGLVSAVKLTEALLAERKKRHGSGGSCGGSKGGSGSPDNGSGEGDGEGGGVSA